MIPITGIPQGTSEWLRLRLGVLTASNVSRLLTPTTLKLSAQREGLKAQLVAERLLGEPCDEFGGTYWTERGQALEAEAGAYFALQTGHDPQPVSFVYRGGSQPCGCSPDWMIADGDEWAAGVEVKCPKAATHVQYLLDGDAIKYTPQVQYSLWVTGLPTWYFMSYYPGLRPLLVACEPDADWQKAFNANVDKFLDEVHAATEALR